MIEVSNTWKENQRRLLADRVGLCIKVYDGEEYAVRIADVPLPAGESAPPINVANILSMTYNASFDELSMESPRLQVQLNLSNVGGINNKFWETLLEADSRAMDLKWVIYAVYDVTSSSPEKILLASLIMSEKSLSSDENIITITLVPEFALAWDTMFIPEAKDFSTPGGTFQYDLYDVVEKLKQDLGSNITVGSLSNRILMLGMPFRQQKAGDALQLIANAFGLSVAYKLYQPSDSGFFPVTVPEIMDPVIRDNLPEDYLLVDKILYDYPYLKTPEGVNTVIEVPSYSPYTFGSSEHLGTSFNLACPYLAKDESAWIDYPKVLVEDLFYNFGFQEEELEDIPIDILKAGVAGCLIKNTGSAALASGYNLYVEGYFSDVYNKTYELSNSINNGKTQTVNNALGMNITEFSRSYNQIQGKDIYEASFRADPRLECGDYVILATKRKKIVARVLKLKYEYNGAWKGSATLRHVEDVAPLELIADDTVFLTNALT